MRAILASLLFCCGLGAQSFEPIFINAGGPPIPGDQTAVPKIPDYQADQFFTGGTAWADPAMGAGVFATLRYGTNFSYDVKIPNGFYTVKLSMLEPNKTGPNQRRFTVMANGIQSDPIDLFALTGAVNAQYTTTLMAMVGNGHLKLTFVATLSNAVVSAIDIEQAVNLPTGSVILKLYQCAPPLSDVTCSPAIPIGDVTCKPTPVPGEPPDDAGLVCNWFALSRVGRRYNYFYMRQVAQ
jgi:hypothetical protein